VVSDSSFERLAPLADAVSLTSKFIARLSKQSDEALPHHISVLHRNGRQKSLGSPFHPDTRVNNRSVGNKIQPCHVTPTSPRSPATFLRVSISTVINGLNVVAGSNAFMQADLSRVRAYKVALWCAHRALSSPITFRALLPALHAILQVQPVH
jgi:hypothetical protein